MAVPMTTEQANAVYDLLVQHCDAPASDDSWMRSDFIHHQTAGATDEYRFQGSLGFGGKFWNCNGRWYVSSYREAIERWPAMQQQIDACNEALAALRDELMGAGR